MFKALALFVFMALWATAAVAESDCDSVLNGAQNISASSFRQQKIDDTIRMLKSYKFSSKQTAMGFGTSGTAKLPIEGIPAAFDGDFMGSHSANESWGELAADYLNEHRDETISSEQFKKQVDAHSVDAWESCMVTINTSPGLHCWTVIGDDPETVELNVKFVPDTGQMNLARITSATSSSKNIDVSILKDATVQLSTEPFNLSRTDPKAGSIDIRAVAKDGSIVERCNVRVPRVVFPPPEPPCVFADDHGSCQKCEFKLSEEDLNDAGNMSSMEVGTNHQYTCAHMRTDAPINVAIFGDFEITGGDPNSIYKATLGIGGCKAENATEVTGGAKQGKPTIVHLAGERASKTGSDGACTANIRYIMNFDSHEPVPEQGRRPLTAQKGSTLVMTVQ